MLPALLADLTGGASNRLAEYAIKGLAVGGGFLVGYFVGRLVAWGLDRWLFAHKAPEQLKRVCAMLFGLALAIVVALVVFGPGGGGLFGGAGDGKGPAATDDKGKPPPAAAPKEDAKDPPPKIVPKPDAKPTPGDVRVAILSGADVRDGRFYLLDGDPSPRTLDELKRAVAERPKDKGEVVLVFRFAKEPLADTHPELKRLAAWVRDARLTSRFE